MHLGNLRLARRPPKLTVMRPIETDKEQDAENEADEAERLGPGEQALDQTRRPQAEGERNEAGEA